MPSNSIVACRPTLRGCRNDNHSTSSDVGCARPRGGAGAGWQVGYSGIVDEGLLAAMSIDDNEVRWQAIIDGQVESQQTLVSVVDDCVVGFASIGPYRSETVMTRRCRRPCELTPGPSLSCMGSE